MGDVANPVLSGPMERIGTDMAHLNDPHPAPRKILDVVAHADAPGVLRAARATALWLIAAAITAADAVSFWQSYRGLFDWFHGHGFSLANAIVGPLMVDTFLAVGELTVFVLTVPWPGRPAFGWKARVPAWLITCAGLVASIAGNVGHTWAHGQLFAAPVATMVTSAVPPIAAASALAVGLGLLKKLTVTAHKPVAPQSPVRRPVPAATRHHRPKPSGENGVTELMTPVTGENTEFSPADRAANAILAHLAAHGEPPSARSIAIEYLGGETRRNRAQRLIDKLVALDRDAYQPPDEATAALNGSAR